VAAGDVDEADRAPVVEGGDPGGAWPGQGEERLGRLRSLDLGQPPGQLDADVAEPADRGAVAPSALGGSRLPATVEVGDQVVPEVGEVSHGQLEPERVVGAHDVDPGRAHRAEQAHDGDGCGECRQPPGRQRAAEQDHGLGPLRQQGADRDLLGALTGDPAEEHLVPGRLRRGIHAVEDVAVEVVADPEDHADRAGAGARASQPARPGVRLVVELARGLQHPGAGRVGRPGGTAEDDRHERPGDARAGCHVLHRHRSAGHGRSLARALHIRRPEALTPALPHADTRAL
jgi:hypothetical protein